MPADYTTRGRKDAHPLGTAAFVGLRALDPFVQHSVLAHGTGRAIIEAIGSSLNTQGPTSNTGYAFLDNLGLSPYRLILFGMATASSIKQIIWKMFIGEEHMSVTSAAGVGFFNTILNAVNNILFICRATSPGTQGEGPNWEGFPPRALAFGSTLFGVGMFIETVSEIQRKAARKPGVPYKKGLWGLTRHPNYLGYTLWRTGYAIAAGGWIWGAINFGLFTWDFTTRAIPVLEDYCETKYADLWHDYARTVKSKFFPGLI